MSLRPAALANRLIRLHVQNSQNIWVAGGQLLLPGETVLAASLKGSAVVPDVSTITQGTAMAVIDAPQQQAQFVVLDDVMAPELDSGATICQSPAGVNATEAACASMTPSTD